MTKVMFYVSEYLWLLVISILVKNGVGLGSLELKD